MSWWECGFTFLAWFVLLSSCWPYYPLGNRMRRASSWLVVFPRPRPLPNGGLFFFWLTSPLVRFLFWMGFLKRSRVLDYDVSFCSIDSSRCMAYSYASIGVLVFAGILLLFFFYHTCCEHITDPFFLCNLHNLL